MKRTPLKRKSATKRRTKSPRCSVRGCKQIARIDTYCRSHAQREADRLFSLYIRQRDETCRVRGAGNMAACAGGLQCAHVISRRYHAIRWSPTNAVALCAAHHVYFTHRPLEWEMWVKFQQINYEQLRHDALFNEPPHLEVVLRDLRLKVAA